MNQYNSKLELELVDLSKIGVRLSKEKEDLEKYYLLSNEQYFHRFDIQKNLSSNFSSLQNFQNDNFKKKNMNNFNKRNLIVSENEKKPRFQSLFRHLEEKLESETMSIENINPILNKGLGLKTTSSKKSHSKSEVS